MARTSMATAVGTAVLFYLVLSGRLSTAEVDEERRLLRQGAAEAVAAREERRRRKEEEKERRRRAKRRLKWPERSPVGWGEAARVAAGTVKFAYRETLGRWHLGEIAFGIKYYMKQQGDLQHEFAASDSSRLLSGSDVQAQLVELLSYLKLCMYFSKKQYKVFLELAGFCQDDVLIQKHKGRVLKPSFTVVRDGNRKCFLLFIRGAISVRDRLTAATGLEVPFHNVVKIDGHVRQVVLGYAHCGMVVAARWIAKQTIPALISGLDQFPDYQIKIIGHSMGAGIASLLTIILRENDKLASTTCIAYAPAACMTWELAESSTEFITTLINKNDVVPSFSKVSSENLRKEVMASSWIPDLREQIQRTRFLGFVNRSVSYVRSRLPFISNPKSKVVDADITEATASEEVEMKQSADKYTVERKPHPLACWPCIATENRAIEHDEDHPGKDQANETAAKFPKNSDEDEPEKTVDEALVADLLADTGNGANHHETDREDEKEEGKEANDADGTDFDSLQMRAEDKPGSSGSQEASGSQETRQFYPPGRLLHMLVLPASPPANSADSSGTLEESVGIYRTPRELYSKIRLARSMIREHYMPRYIKTLELLIDKINTEPNEAEAGAL